MAEQAALEAKSMQDALNASIYAPPTNQRALEHAGCAQPAGCARSAATAHGRLHPARQ